MISVLVQTNDGTPTAVVLNETEPTVRDALRAAYISTSESDRVSMNGLDVSLGTVLENDGALIQVTHKNTQGFLV